MRWDVYRIGTFIGKWTDPLTWVDVFLIEKRGSFASRLSGWCLLSSMQRCNCRAYTAPSFLAVNSGWKFGHANGQTNTVQQKGQKLQIAEWILSLFTSIYGWPWNEIVLFSRGISYLHGRFSTKMFVCKRATRMIRTHRAHWKGRAIWQYDIVWRWMSWNAYGDFPCLIWKELFRFKHLLFNALAQRGNPFYSISGKSKII